MAPRAAIYTWFRGDQEEDSGETLDVQEARCRSFAEAQGYTVVDVFRETTSMPAEDRPELRRLRGAIWRRAVDVVIATEPKRLYLDTDRLVRMAKEAGGLGVRLEFLEMPVILEGMEGFG